MPVDRSSGRPDGPERRSDACPDRAAAPRHGPDAATRFTETRSRATCYAELRAADNDPLSRLSHAEPAPDGGTSGSAWDSPELADHPDRPAPDAFRVSPERAAHILDGDATGGGHRHRTGRPGKTEFPADWPDQKIIENVVGVARYPDTAPVSQAWNSRWQTRGVRDDVDIVVIVESDGRIWSAWPLEGSPGVVRNPKKAAS
jgi:Bacterial EndoU nuclease